MAQLSPHYVTNASYGLEFLRTSPYIPDGEIDSWLVDVTETVRSLVAATAGSTVSILAGNALVKEDPAVGFIKQLFIVFHDGTSDLVDEGEYITFSK